jgi:hypothetical protein
MRVCPFDLGDRTGNGNRLRAVELSVNRVMRDDRDNGDKQEARRDQTQVSSHGETPPSGSQMKDYACWQAGVNWLLAGQVTLLG